MTTDSLGVETAKQRACSLATAGRLPRLETIRRPAEVDDNLRRLDDE